MRPLVAAATAAVALLSIACGGDDADDEGAPAWEPPTVDCKPGESERDDGACIPLGGLPADMPCPPAQWQDGDGVCIPAGIPADACAEGFVHDDDVGCEPILPAAPCPAGLMAVPGETRCREVAPCAAGAWGAIPVEPDTEYVDAEYAGMDSDGTADKPWTSIQAGVDAAAAGAIVAIAEGSYPEDVDVTGKPVRLWGVCPVLVEVVGTGAELAAIVVRQDAAGTEVHDLAIRGEAIGFGASGSLDVLLERVWVHDNDDLGVDVENSLGATNVVIRGSLIEQNREVGVLLVGAEATVESSVVRGTRPTGLGLYGHGVGVHPHPSKDTAATLVLAKSVVEQSRELGVFVAGSTATIEASVVRDTQPNAQRIGGRGVNVQPHPTTGGPATLVLRASLVERNHDVGVFVAGSDATVEGSVIRTTEADAREHSGRGVSVQSDGTAATLVLGTSLIVENRDVGLFIEGSTATVDATVVRDTQPDAAQLGGRGVNVQTDPTTAAPSLLLLRTSLVELSREAGIFVYGSEATVEASIVRDTQPDAQGLRGRGVHVQARPATGVPSTLVLRSSIVERSHELGVGVFGSAASIESCLVRDTSPNVAGHFGDGVIALSDPGPASLTVSATRIEGSARAAVTALGAHAAIQGSALACQAFDLDSESYQGTAATFEDLGDNFCGCPDATGGCTAVSAELAPPPPLDPAE